MITTRLARKNDLPAIESLLALYGKFTVTHKHINHRDVAVCAHDSEGRLVGFLWCGMMAGNTVVYLDKFTVHPECSRGGVGHMLAMAALEQVVKRGGRELFGIIKQDEFHDKSAMNALKCAIGAESLPYTYVRAQISHLLSELSDKGA